MLCSLMVSARQTATALPFLTSSNSLLKVEFTIAYA